MKIFLFKSEHFVSSLEKTFLIYYLNFFLLNVNILLCGSEKPYAICALFFDHIA